MLSAQQQGSGDASMPGYIARAGPITPPIDRTVRQFNEQAWGKDAQLDLKKAQCAPAQAVHDAAINTVQAVRHAVQVTLFTQACCRGRCWHASNACLLSDLDQALHPCS